MSGERVSGHRLREEIADLVSVGEVVHYLALVDRLHDAGFAMSGEDRKGEGANVLVALKRSPAFESVAPRSGEWRRIEQRGNRTPQEWADFLASAIFQLTSEGERDGFVSDLPPDAAVRLKAAVDTYCAAYEREDAKSGIARVLAEQADDPPVPGIDGDAAALPTQPSDKEEHPDRGSEAVGFVFNVELEPGEPTLFERREDGEQYAALFADVRAEEETVMDEALAANFISEAENDIAVEQGKEDA